MKIYNLTLKGKFEKMMRYIELYFWYQDIRWQLILTGKNTKYLNWYWKHNDRFFKNDQYILQHEIEEMSNQSKLKNKYFTNWRKHEKIIN